MAAVSLASLLLTAGCGGREVPERAGAAQATQAAPDSDMCAEHGVLEAVCTKCNPALVPVFQAKGDWCAAHGFPESFCPTCHPERGGRPAADLASAAGSAAAAAQPPAHGTKIRFRSPETERLAGIETVPAVERPNQTAVAAVARIAWDARRAAQVNARAAGVVRAVLADVGTTVRRGAPLARIESAAVGADQSRLQAARARVEVAAADHARLKALLDEGIAASKDVLAAQQELQAARAEEAAVETALRVAGTDGAAGDATYALAAPLPGVVTRREASVGALVDAGQVLFQVVDPSVVWAELDVRESDLAVVASGQRVTLTIDALGGREFAGEIEYLAPEVDPRTRTALARVSLSNPDGALRANMFGRARIAAGAQHTAVAVPREAVQEARGARLVFVRLGDGLYETRRVDVTGPAGTDLVELASGVRPGEIVVTTGSFLLKTETLKESIGAGCCDVQ